MVKKTEIGENLCTHKPQPGVEYNSLYMDNRRQRIESVKTIHDVNVGVQKSRRITGAKSCEI